MARRDSSTSSQSPVLPTVTSQVVNIIISIDPPELLGFLFLVVAAPFLVRIDWLATPFAFLVGVSIVGIIVFRACLFVFETRLTAARGAAAFRELAVRWPALASARWLSATMLCLCAYATMNWIPPLTRPATLDPMLANLELTILGGWHPTIWLQDLVSPVLTLWFSAMYAVHLLWFFLTPGTLTRQERHIEQQHVTFAILLAMYLGFIGYLTIPILGPLAGMADRYVVEIDHNLITLIVRDFGVAHGTFPSLHAAVSFVVVAFAWKYNRRLFWPMLIIACNIWLSTLYFRYHYIVDLLAGWALAAFVVWFSPVFIRWYTWARMPNPRP
jgi:membrane-associated phospholipid phosphatase